jgi:hypothetical protein
MTTTLGDRTINERFAKLFKGAAIPVKEINAFGTRVIVTCWTEGAARKVARLLTKGSFAVDGLKESVDYKVEGRDTNQPKVMRVWRVWAHA